MEAEELILRCITRVVAVSGRRINSQKPQKHRVSDTSPGLGVKIHIINKVTLAGKQSLLSTTAEPSWERRHSEIGEMKEDTRSVNYFNLRQCNLTT